MNPTRLQLRRHCASRRRSAGALRDAILVAALAAQDMFAPDARDPALATPTVARLARLVAARWTACPASDRRFAYVIPRCFAVAAEWRIPTPQECRHLLVDRRSARLTNRAYSARRQTGPHAREVT